MKSLNSILAIVLIVSSSSLWADSDDDDYEERTSIQQYDSARVIKVKPIYREVKVSNPVTECWDEAVTHTRNHKGGHNSAGGMVAGGLIGGIIGHQIGKGRGKKIATAMGTLIGAQIGHDSMKHQSKKHREEYTRYEERCDVRHQVSYERVVDGYWVTYKYAGERHKIEMPYHPGKRIKMRIHATPVI